MTTTAQYKAALFTDVIHARVDSASGTSVHAAVANGDDLTFHGKGFTFNSSGVSGGTVTGVDAHIQGVTMHIQGTFNAHALYVDIGAAQQGHSAALLALAHGHHVVVDLPNHGHTDFVL